MTRRTSGAAGLLLAVALLAGCGDEYDGYCEVVEEKQAELTEIATSGEQGALLRALPIYEELREEAPDDITDEWQQVIRALQALQQALDDAGASASTYDPKNPPEGVTQDQQDAIAAAADELRSPATVAALDSVEQQARDVCHTPLTL